MARAAAPQSAAGEEGHVGGAIVVGVDGSEINRGALRWAATEAAIRGTHVEAVHAWDYLDQPAGRFDPHFGADAARARISRFIDETLGDDGSVPVVLQVVNDHASRALVDASADACMIVVGARGMGAVKGALLGSVSQHVIHHARCPVLVVR